MVLFSITLELTKSGSSVLKRLPMARSATRRSRIGSSSRFCTSFNLLSRMKLLSVSGIRSGSKKAGINVPANSSGDDGNGYCVGGFEHVPLNFHIGQGV